MVSLYDLSLAELTEFCSSLGERPFRARQLYAWLYGKGENDFSKMTDIPASAREKLTASARADGLVLVETLSSKDRQTTKYLFETDDRNIIETVFMKYKDRNSVCISTQAGCRMGCRFCASGQLGLERNLTPSEMALQIILAERASGAMTKNIVLMGIGEPLDNYENVKKFIENFTDDHGRDLSRRAITLSTCGIVPGIERLASELPQVNLAVSLHAPNDAMRLGIMPITKKYNVKDIVKATKDHYEKTHRRSTFEYALIKGFNDGMEHAAELVALLRGMNCIVNLIPLNSSDEDEDESARCSRFGSGSDRDSSPVCDRDNANFRGTIGLSPQDPEHRANTQSSRFGSGVNRDAGSSAESAERFRDELARRHIPVTIRKSLGADIGAACGQLRLRRRQTEI